jgi:hypothetical protein
MANKHGVCEEFVARVEAFQEAKGKRNLLRPDLLRAAAKYLFKEASWVDGDYYHRYNYATEAKEILDAARAYEAALNAVEETGCKIWENRIVEFSYPCTNVGNPTFSHPGWTLPEDDHGFWYLINHRGSIAEGQPNSYCGSLSHGCLACQESLDSYVREHGTGDEQFAGNKHKAWEFRQRLVEQGLLTDEQVGAMTDPDIVAFAPNEWKSEDLKAKAMALDDEEEK